MNSRSKTVRNIANKCCTWGARTTVSAQNYVGGPVPLLRNPAQAFFKALFLMNGAFLGCNVLTFILQQFTVIANITEADERLKEIAALEEQTEEILAEIPDLEKHIKIKGSC